MSIPTTKSPSLSESTTPPTGSLGPTPLHWTGVEPADELGKKDILAQIQSLIRDIPCPWKTMELIPSSVATVVMDVLQQELDDASDLDGYGTACMKCLRSLSKAQNIVPSSIFLRDVTREGGNPVAGGGFADIWKGRLHDTQVCLKVLRIFDPEKDRAKLLRDFCQEALVWRQLRHPNILPFLGVSEDLFTPRYCLISPWMVNGNIMSYLEAHPDHDRLTSLVQVAEGMKYLHNHNPPIVHADIRGANILIKDDLRCCLADFGLSLFAESQALESSSRMRKGSIRWLAPEYIDPNVVIDRACITARDIYAYGCTVIEIFTGKPPFSDIKNEAAVIHAVMKGSRPLRPQHLLLEDGLWSLVTMCLTTSPSQRPNAERISNVLAEGVDSLSFSNGMFTRARIMDIIDTPVDGFTSANIPGFSIHKSKSTLGKPSDGLRPVDDRADGNSKVFADDARFSATVTTTTISGALGVDAPMPRPMPYEANSILHHCSLCSRDIRTVGIHQHLKEFHHGYSQYGRYPPAACTVCGILLGMKSRADHVAQQHSGIDTGYPNCGASGVGIDCNARICPHSRTASDSSSNAHTSEKRGHDFDSTEKAAVEENNYGLLFGLETNVGLPSQPARARSVRRSPRDRPLASADGEVEHYGPVQNRSLPQSPTGRDESFGEVEQPPLLAPPRTIPQTGYTDTSNTSARSSHGRSNATSTANLPNSADAASTPNFPFSPPPTIASQTECNFTPNISAPPPCPRTNVAYTVNPIYQIGCNVAPNIFAAPSYDSANTSMANPVYQIGCNFTPNISVPPSHNASSMANSLYPLPTPTAYQIGCRFAPTFTSSSCGSANVGLPSSPPMPPIITSLSTKGGFTNL